MTHHQFSSASKAYVNEDDAKKQIKAQKFDQLDETVIPVEKFKDT